MMINEMSIAQQNKNAINKIMSKIKQAGSSVHEYKDVSIFLPEEYYDICMRIRYDLNIEGYKLIQESDWLYLCANVTPTAKLCWYGYRGGGGGSDDAESVAYGYLHDKLRYARDSYMSPPMNIVERIERDTGLDFNMDYDKSTVEKTDAYKKIVDCVSSIMSSRTRLILRDEVHKRLSERYDIVPLIFYKSAENTLSYPTDRLPYGKLMATSCRYEVSMESALKNAGRVASQTIRYTPWDEWTKVDLTGISSKYLDVKHTMDSQ